LNIFHSKQSILEILIFKGKGFPNVRKNK